MNFPILIYKGVYLTVGSFFSNKKYITIYNIIKEKKINSCIGIDGIIRKIGMLIAILFLMIIDNIINLDLIGFIPEEIKTIFDLVLNGSAEKN